MPYPDGAPRWFTQKDLMLSGDAIDGTRFIVQQDVCETETKEERKALKSQRMKDIEITLKSLIDKKNAEILAKRDN